MRRGSITVLLSLIIALNLFADTERQRESMRRISPLRVIVEDLRSDVTSSTGLTAEQLRTDVELRLRRAGITVIDRGTGPFLWISVNAMLPTSSDGALAGLAVASMLVALNQIATLPGKGGLEFSVLTWTTSSVVFTPSNQFAEWIRQRSIPDLVDQFLNAYLSVNPSTSRN